MRNICRLYPSNEIFPCPEWLTPMRRLDLRAINKASLHSSPPPQKSGHKQQRNNDPPARQGLLLNQKIPPGILLGLSSSSKGIKDSNGHTAIWDMAVWPLDSLIPLEEEGKSSNIPGGICWFSSSPCRAGGSLLRCYLCVHTTHCI